MYLSITGATPDKKLAKYLAFDTEAEAQAHAAEYNGFSIANPDGDQEFWVVDMAAKTVTFDKSASDSNVAKRVVMSKINELEAEVTPRRIRDAFADPGWMNAQEAKIKTERDKL